MEAKEILETCLSNLKEALALLEGTGPIIDDHLKDDKPAEPNYPIWMGLEGDVHKYLIDGVVCRMVPGEHSPAVTKAMDYFWRKSAEEAQSQLGTARAELAGAIEQKDENGRMLTRCRIARNTAIKEKNDWRSAAEKWQRKHDAACAELADMTKERDQWKRDGAKSELARRVAERELEAITELHEAAVLEVIQARVELQQVEKVRDAPITALEIMETHRADEEAEVIARAYKTLWDDGTGPSKPMDPRDRYWFRRGVGAGRQREGLAMLRRFTELLENEVQA